MKKTVVLMPERISEFIPALAVVNCKASDPEIEIILVVQERLYSLCLQLCSFKVMSFHRNSKRELGTFLDLLQMEHFYKLYNCSFSHVAFWLSKKLDIPIKRSISEPVTNIKSFSYEDLDSDFGNKVGISNNYTQFLEMPIVDVDQFDITLAKIKKKIKKIIKPQIRVEQHITHKYAQILEVYDFDPDKWKCKKVVQYDNEYKGMIVLCPGGDNFPGRLWPYFSDIVRLLTSHEFVILGNEKDIEVSKSIAPRFQHRVRNLVGKVSFDKAASIIAGASVVVSNDSGFLQIAGFIGVQSIGIFGSSSPEKSRPLGTSSKIVYLNEKCSPCQKDVCNKIDCLCMTKIEPDKIAALIWNICSGVEIGTVNNSK